MTTYKTLLSTCVAIFGATLLTSGKAAADVVFPDDVIVQGSLCVGLDCVDGEVFGFDTIKLKENNLRIFFDDTSVSVGFPANKWRITINDSASGGANFFSVDDATANRSVFKVTAGAPANALFVASTGNVGIGTAAPALDLTITTSDTPAQRLEQTNSGGFTAQTWDVAGNEANFFVRDVTGGSRLPFRIRPGAPTSSIDISASGNVGIGTASPPSLLAIKGGAAPTLTVTSDDASGDAGTPALVLATALTATKRYTVQRNAVTGFLDLKGGEATFSGYTFNVNNGTEVMRINNAGSVGIGTNAPSARLHTIGTVRFAGITGCSGGLQTDGSGNVACLISSRQFKTLGGELSPEVALKNVMALRPQTGSYKDTPDVPEHWLIAEDVAAVDPALAGFNDGKPYTVKTQNIVADLVAVVQQQQRRIDELERRIAAK